MRKLRSLLIGIGLGTAVGVIFVTLFSPVRGQEARHNLRDHFRNARQAARDASAQRRQELEAELQQMRDKRNE